MNDNHFVVKILCVCDSDLAHLILKHKNKLPFYIHIIGAVNNEQLKDDGYKLVTRHKFKVSFMLMGPCFVLKKWDIRKLLTKTVGRKWSEVFGSMSMQPVHSFKLKCVANTKYPIEFISDLTVLTRYIQNNNKANSRWHVGIIDEDNLVRELCKRNLRPRAPIMNSDREKLMTKNHFDILDEYIEEIITEVDASFYI